MYLQELLFFMQCLLGMVMLIMLQKMNQLKKQIDSITKEVMQYLAFLEEDTETNDFFAKGPKEVKISKEAVENHLIQAVLKEYFP